MKDLEQTGQLDVHSGQIALVTKSNCAQIYSLLRQRRRAMWGMIQMLSCMIRTSGQTNMPF